MWGSSIVGFRSERSGCLNFQQVALKPEENLVDCETTYTPAATLYP